MTVTRETVACISPGINFQGPFHPHKRRSQDTMFAFLGVLDSRRDLCSIPISGSDCDLVSLFSVLRYSLHNGSDTAIVSKVENLAEDGLTDGTDGWSVSQAERLMNWTQTEVSH